ncbi:phage virion morphogenesis protein [Variovorax sp. OV700]|uniref:phage virion morphogenesis protein n=1 Tax=Variovorax sp. OV700 TaxID=1882826 RepID=UPI0008809809|nr:phage virion morphogenesis protein [Variovorax sp. OV700]SDI78265.1 phage virion morphogenesis (putative tail completion) protein [Variovorax sp. OV700]
MTAGDPLSALEDWIAPLLAKLEPAQRRMLARNVGQTLRRSQAERIAAQQNPDGSAYAARKPSKARQQQGRIRRTMFAKMRTARHLRLQASEDVVTIGFLSRTSRIARVHQEGLSDLVESGGPAYRYPMRELLGLSGPEREYIKDLLLRFLAN